MKKHTFSTGNTYTQYKFIYLKYRFIPSSFKTWLDCDTIESARRWFVLAFPKSSKLLFIK